MWTGLSAWLAHHLREKIAKCCRPISYFALPASNVALLFMYTWRRSTCIASGCRGTSPCSCWRQLKFPGVWELGTLCWAPSAELLSLGKERLGADARELLDSRGVWHPSNLMHHDARSGFDKGRECIDDKKIKDFDIFNGEEHKWRECSMKLLATVKEHDSFIYALMILAEAEEEGISDLEAAPNHEGTDVRQLQFITRSSPSSVARRVVFIRECQTETDMKCDKRCNSLSPLRRS